LNYKAVNEKTKHGAVILLDVLGTKNTLEQLNKYLVEIESLYNQLDLLKQDPLENVNVKE
jgi:hypothetical protein